MMTPANRQRGEASIQVGQREFLLRPTFAALVLAEEDIGSLFAVVDRAAEGKISLNDIACLLWHCLPENDRPTKEQVGDAVLSMGLLAATDPLRVILAQVLKGQV